MIPIGVNLNTGTLVFAKYPPVFFWQGKQYFVWLHVNPYSVIVYDNDTNWYQFISPIEGIVPRKTILIPWCVEVCNEGIRRPHLTCKGFCWYKKVWEGHLPNMIPIEAPYISTTLRYRKRTIFEQFIIKKLEVLQEFWRHRQ